MKKKNVVTISKNRRLIILLASVFTVLCVPLIAMQFSTEVNWSAFDFVVAGILLVGTVLGIEFVFRRFKRFNHRIIMASILLLLLLLVWLELAVGVFGSPIAGS